MRVFSCKSYCPTICSSKSFSSPCSLKLEVSQHVSSGSPQVSDALDANFSDEKTVVVKDESVGEEVEIVLKSSLKKSPGSPGSGSIEVGKKRVKWVDYMGTELAEIREFEHSESGSSEYYGDQIPACACVIQ